MSESCKEAAGPRIRPLNMKDFDKEVKTVHEIYTRGLAAELGRSPDDGGGVQLRGEGPESRSSIPRW